MRLMLDDKDRVVIHHFPDVRKYSETNGESISSILDRFQKWLLTDSASHISSMTTKIISLNSLIQDFLRDN